MNRNLLSMECKHSKPSIFYSRTTHFSTKIVPQGKKQARKCPFYQALRAFEMSPCTPPYPEKVTNGSVTVFVLLGSKQTIAGVPQRIWNTIHLCLPILSQNPTKPPKSRFLAYKKNLDVSYRPIQGSLLFRYFGVEFLYLFPLLSMEYIASILILHAFLQSLQRIQKVTWRYGDI